MKKRGFTLMEVLTVVLIVGVLTAVALPQYRKFTRKAKLQNVLVRLRVIRDASDRLAQVNGYKDFMSFATAKQAESTERYPFFAHMGIADDEAFKGCTTSTYTLNCPELSYSLLDYSGTKPTNYVLAYSGDYRRTFPIGLAIALTRQSTDAGAPPSIKCGRYFGFGTDEVDKYCEALGLGMTSDLGRAQTL